MNSALSEKLHNFLISYWLTAVAFCLPFILYLFTVAPTIYNLDSAELTTAAATGGLMRATGYPLYLSLGYLWSKIPIGDVGYRLNLFSAFNGALTIALLERILRRWRVAPWATLSALGLLATGAYFWGLSLVAEVYTLHTALLAALILVLLRWSEKPCASGLAAVGLIIGLGLSHHMATILLLPGAVWYLLTGIRSTETSVKSTLLFLGAFLAGLSFYLYLPLRFIAQPAFNYAGVYDVNLNFMPVDLLSLDGLWWLISGRAFAGQMFAYQGLEIGREIWHFVEQLWQAFFIIGFGPGLLGAFTLYKRHRKEATMLALMFALNSIFYINYRVLDKVTMFLPSYVIWSLWAAFGFQEIFAWVRQADQDWLNQRLTNLLRAVVILSVVLAAVWNWRFVDLSEDWSARKRGETILQTVQPEALILGWWDTVPVIQYLQLVEGVRSDVQAVNRFLLKAEYINGLIARETNYRPVYVDSPPQDFPYSLESKSKVSIYRIQVNKSNDNRSREP